MKGEENIGAKDGDENENGRMKAQGAWALLCAPGSTSADGAGAKAEQLLRWSV